MPFLCYGITKNLNMNKNLLIIGVCSHSFLLKQYDKYLFNDKTSVVCTEGMLTYYLKYKKNIRAIDIKSYQENDTKASLNIDTREIDNFYETIINTPNDIINSAKFILGYHLIELRRLVRFLNMANDINYVIIPEKSYQLLMSINEPDFFNKNIKWIVHKPKPKTILKCIYQYRRLSYYGRYGYLKYFLTLPFYLLSQKRNRSKKLELNLICNNSDYAFRLCRQYFPKMQVESYESLLSLGLFNFLKTYRARVLLYKDILKKNEKFDCFLSSDFFMKGVFLYVYAPFMDYYKDSINYFLKNNKTITTLVQSTDVSPHRYLWAVVAGKNNIRTIVTQHGEITEPLMITSITSSEGWLSTKSTFDLYNANYRNEDKKIIYKKVDTKRENRIKKNKHTRRVQNVYIFTISYTGNSFDASLVFNHNMVKHIVSIFKNKKVNIIIKAHPSERIQMYSLDFPQIVVSKDKLNDVLSDIDIAICGPSTIYSELKSFGIETYYYGKGLQRKFGFPESEYSFFEKF